MKHILSLLIVTSLAALAEKPAADIAALKHPVKACLWKVEGNGLAKPSWLFGTIHLGDAQIITLHPNAQKAFDASDAVYTELSFEPGEQMKLMPLLMRQDGGTLGAAIGEKLTAEVNAELAAINPALNIAPLQPLKTWAAAVTIPLLKIQLGGQQPLDSVLYQRAQSAEKRVAGLETPAGQVGAFEVLKEAEQVTLLAETVKMMREDREKNIDSLERLRVIYLTKNADGIAKFMRAEMARMDGNKELLEKLMKSLLDDRNKGMAEKARELLAAEPGKSHFFAVGAGHYAGETGVQKLLAKEGYKITPMFE